MKASFLWKIFTIVIISFSIFFGIAAFTMRYTTTMVTDLINTRNYESILNEKKDAIKSQAQIIQSMIEGFLSGSHGQDFETRLNGVRKLIRDAKFGDNGYFFAYSYDGLRLSYQPAPDTEMEANLYDSQDKQGNYLVRDMIEAAKKGGDFTTYYWDNPATGKVEPKVGFYFPVKIDGFQLFVGVGEYIYEIQELNNRFVEVFRERMRLLLVRELIAFSLFFVAALLVLYFLLRRFIRPLKNIAFSFTQIAMGDADLTSRIAVHSRDEIGTVADKFNNFIGNLGNIVLETRNIIDRTVEIEESLRSSTNSTNTSVNGIAENIDRVRSQLNHLNNIVADSATAMEQISANVGAFDHQIGSQAAMVEESTAAINEMIASLSNVEGITRTKRESITLLSRTMQEGRSHLENTKTDFNQVVATMDEINEMAAIIGSIADQTNMLSMNAAIEAAHAGEAGKGFAVVAEEIRKLAENAGDSSSSIANLVHQVGEGISTTNQNVIGVDTIFSRISSEIESTVAAFQEIEYSISELNTGGSQVLDAAQEINNATISIREGSLEIRSGVQTMMDSAEGIREISGEVAGDMGRIGSESNEIKQAVNGIVEINSRLAGIVEVLNSEFGKFKI